MRDLYSKCFWSLFQLLQILLLSLWWNISSHLFFPLSEAQSTQSIFSSWICLYWPFLPPGGGNNAEGSFLKENSSLLLVMPSSSTMSPAPWMPSRTSGCSQMCFAEYRSPAPLTPMSEALALTFLVFFHSLSLLAAVCPSCGSFCIVLSPTASPTGLTQLFAHYCSPCSKLPFYFYYCKHALVGISTCLQEKRLSQGIQKKHQK